MNVLVTGGTGSIGSWVTHYLHERDIHPVVYDVDVNETYLTDIADDVTIVEGDVTDYEQLTGTMEAHDVDRVIHLAKLLEPTATDQPGLALEVNVVGSGNVFRAADENGIDRIVYSSSKSAFAEITAPHAPPEFEPLPADHPKFDPTTSAHIPFYSLTNRMIDYFGIRFAMLRDLEFVITRFGSTWGPGKISGGADYFESLGRDPTGGTLISYMIDRAIAGKGTTGEPREDNFVYTKDIAQGVAKCAMSDDIAFENNHREFHLDGGRPFAISEFVNELVDRFPALDIELDEAGGMVSHRPGIQCVFDITRPRAELAYEPTYDAPAGIEDYLEMEARYR